MGNACLLLEVAGTCSKLKSHYPDSPPYDDREISVGFVDTVSSNVSVF